MKVFIFESVSQLTNRWHHDGGLVVIAEDKATAEKLIEQENEGKEDSMWSEAQIELTDEEWDSVLSYKLEDTLPPAKPRVLMFPDAGCC